MRARSKLKTHSLETTFDMKYFLLKGPLLLIIALISSSLLRLCIGLIWMTFTKRLKGCLERGRITDVAPAVEVVVFSQHGLMAFIQSPQKLNEGHKPMLREHHYLYRW